MALWLVQIVGLAACGGSGPTSSGGDGAVASAAEASDVSTARGGTKSQRIGRNPVKVVAPIADPESLANKWLVVTRKGDDAGLERLTQHPELAASPMRVPSNSFRALSPCGDLVVAGAFVGRDEAAFMQRRLAAIDVATDLAFSGAFVGRRPKLESLCEAADAAGTGTCGDVRLVEMHGTHADVALSLDAAAATAAVSSATAPALVGGVWEAPLSDTTLGGLTVGDVWTGAAPGGSASPCKVAGFVVVTRTSGGEEPCGGPQVFARLACASSPAFVLPPGAPAPVHWAIEGSPKPSALAAAMVAVTSSSAFVDALRDIERVAEARRGAVSQDFDVKVVRQGDVAGILVVATLTTGSTAEVCSQDGDQRTIAGIVDGQGGVWHAFHDLGAGTVDEVVDLDGDGRPEMLESSWPNFLTLRGTDGAVRCAVRPPLCRNPC